VCFGINIVLAAALAGFMQGGGIALALTLASAVNTGLLLWFLTKSDPIDVRTLLVSAAGSRIENVLERCNTGNVTEWNAIKTQIRDALGRYFFEKTKRRPMILPIIQEVR